MRNRKNQIGFTLIELMIVIAIIGILMAYAIPAYRDYTTRTKAGECLSIMAGAKVGVSERWNATNDLAAISTNELALVAAAGTITGPNVTSVTVAGAGVITCLIGGADPSIMGSTVTLNPVAAPGSGSIVWNCTTNIAEPAHRPGNCIP